jgi:hypothetical protein
MSSFLIGNTGSYTSPTISVQGQQPQEPIPQESIPQDPQQEQPVATSTFKSSSMLKGIFLLVLAVCGNFVAETLGCKTQALLSQSMLAKQTVILLIIYFAIDFTSSDDIATHPVDNMKYVLGIWVFYLMFTKMNRFFTVLVFGILSLMYLTSTFVSYYEGLDEKEREKYASFISMYHQSTSYVLYGIGGITLIGFGLYFQKQYKEHRKHWNTMTFIMGKPSCGA